MSRISAVVALAVSLLVGTTRAQSVWSDSAAALPAAAGQAPPPAAPGLLPNPPGPDAAEPIPAPTAKPAPAPIPADAPVPDFGGLLRPPPNDVAVRFGWWGVHNDGSKVKTGEYQDLSSSPFYDIDGILTSDRRTVNFALTGLDNEGNQAWAQMYGPFGKASFDFQRFIRRLDHIPGEYIIDQSPVNPQVFNVAGIISNRPILSTPTPVQFQDLNVGEDYAIRVEQLKGEVGGNLTDNIKAKVQVFQLHKFGERQANAMARCYHPPEFGTTGPLRNVRSCHILSQQQRIDWNTTEVTPRIEGRWGSLNVEYSHQMRWFTQDDQMVSRIENGTGTGLIQGNLPYAVVPENMTHIDQIRAGYDLTDRTHLYTFAYVGNTENQTRDLDRDFWGYDVRLTDRTFRGLTMTSYVRGYHQSGSLPHTLLPEEAKGITETGPNGTTIQEAGEEVLRPQLGFDRTTAGANTRWVPRIGDGMFHRTALIGGYEYVNLARDNAEYETIFLRDRRRTVGILDYTQPTTVSNQVYVGVQQPWTNALSTEAKYKMYFIHQPLNGFREINGYLNSGLPDRQDVLEFLEMWQALPNLGFLMQQDMNFGRRDDVGTVVQNNPINFHEDNYSFVNSVWYAPTPKLALTASGSYLTNWINQIINLGDEYVDPQQPTPPLGGTIPTDSRRWYYGGRAAVFGGRVDYNVLCNVWLHGGYEWVRGDDHIDTRNLDQVGAGRPGATPWTDLPQYSRVLVITQRITAGLDWKPRDRMTVYMRYIYYDFDDKAMAFNSGTSHMVLGGASYIW